MERRRDQEESFLFFGEDALRGSREDGRALLKELGVRYPNGTTFEPEVVRAYRVLGMPSTYFVKPNGEIHETWVGLLNKSKMVDLVEELLKASAPS